MNEARLRIVDEQLHRGWCSYLDIALAINNAILALSEKELNNYGLNPFRKDDQVKGGRYKSIPSFNKQLLDKYRTFIGQDFMDIPQIWSLANEGRILARNGKKSSKEDLEYRTKIRNLLIEEKVDRQYGRQSAKSSVDNADRLNSQGEIDLKKVKFYRYKDRNYSLFTSGDYKKYNELKTKQKVRDKLADATETAVSGIDIKNVLYESDVILELAASDKIKQRIRLQNELNEYEDDVKAIIGNFQSSIAKIGKEKQTGWIRKTINYYKNILELAKSPLSNIDKRQLANHIHDFALFLASENQYQFLEERFEEVINIYQKLVFIQKHAIEDYISGENFFVEEDFNPEEAKAQLRRDKELVAEALLNFARVQLDNHKEGLAESILNKALNILDSECKVRANLLHLRAVVYSVSLKMDLAAHDINQAFECALSLGMEEPELLEIMVSRAELLRAGGEIQEAIRVYDDVISLCRQDKTFHEILASALMSKAMMHITPEDMEIAASLISEALAIFRYLYTQQPDRILPNLLSAKYIQMIIFSQRGDIKNAVKTGNSIINSFFKANRTLKTLCVQEVVQTLLYMKNLYQSLGQRDNESTIDAKIAEIKKRYQDIINPLLLQ